MALQWHKRQDTSPGPTVPLQRSLSASGRALRALIDEHTFANALPQSPAPLPCLRVPPSPTFDAMASPDDALGSQRTVSFLADAAHRRSQNSTDSSNGGGGGDSDSDSDGDDDGNGNRGSSRAQPRLGGGACLAAAPVEEGNDDWDGDLARTEAGIRIRNARAHWLWDSKHCLPCDPTSMRPVQAHMAHAAPARVQLTLVSTWRPATVAAAVAACDGVYNVNDVGTATARAGGGGLHQEQSQLQMEMEMEMEMELDVQMEIDVSTEVSVGDSIKGRQRPGRGEHQRTRASRRQRAAPAHARHIAGSASRDPATGNGCMPTRGKLCRCFLGDHMKSTRRADAPCSKFKAPARYRFPLSSVRRATCDGTAAGVPEDRRVDERVIRFIVRSSHSQHKDTDAREGKAGWQRRLRGKHRGRNVQREGKAMLDGALLLKSGAAAEHLCCMCVAAAAQNELAVLAVKGSNVPIPAIHSAIDAVAMLRDSGNSGPAMRRDDTSAMRAAARVFEAAAVTLERVGRHFSIRERDARANTAATSLDSIVGAIAEPRDTMPPVDDDASCDSLLVDEEVDEVRRQLAMLLEQALALQRVAASEWQSGSDMNGSPGNGSVAIQTVPQPEHAERCSQQLAMREILQSLARFVVPQQARGAGTGSDNAGLGARFAAVLAPAATMTIAARIWAAHMREQGEIALRAAGSPTLQENATPTIPCSLPSTLSSPHARLSDEERQQEAECVSALVDPLFMPVTGRAGVVANALRSPNSASARLQRALPLCSNILRLRTEEHLRSNNRALAQFTVSAVHAAVTGHVERALGELAAEAEEDARAAAASAETDGNNSTNGETNETAPVDPSADAETQRRYVRARARNRGRRALHRLRQRARQLRARMRRGGSVKAREKVAASLSLAARRAWEAADAVLHYDVESVTIFSAHDLWPRRAKAVSSVPSLDDEPEIDGFVILSCHSKSGSLPYESVAAACDLRAFISTLVEPHYVRQMCSYAQRVSGVNRAPRNLRTGLSTDLECLFFSVVETPVLQDIVAKRAPNRCILVSRALRRAFFAAIEVAHSQALEQVLTAELNHCAALESTEDNLRKARRHADGVDGRHETSGDGRVGAGQIGRDNSDHAAHEAAHLEDMAIAYINDTHDLMRVVYRVEEVAENELARAVESKAVPPYYFLSKDLPLAGLDTSFQDYFAPSPAGSDYHSGGTRRRRRNVSGSDQLERDLRATFNAAAGRLGYMCERQRQALAHRSRRAQRALVTAAAHYCCRAIASLYAPASGVRLPPPTQRTCRSVVFEHARGALKRRCAQQKCVGDAVGEYLATWAAGLGFGDGSTPADASAIAFRVMALDFADTLVHGLLSTVMRFVHGADDEVELGIGAIAATGPGSTLHDVLGSDVDTLEAAFVRAPAVVAAVADNERWLSSWQAAIGERVRFAHDIVALLQCEPAQVGETFHRAVASDVSADSGGSFSYAHGLFQAMEDICISAREAEMSCNDMSASQLARARVEAARLATRHSTNQVNETDSGVETAAAAAARRVFRNTQPPRALAAAAAAAEIPGWVAVRKRRAASDSGCASCLGMALGATEFRRPVLADRSVTVVDNNVNNNDQPLSWSCAPLLCGSASPAARPSDNVLAPAAPRVAMSLFSASIPDSSDACSTDGASGNDDTD